MNELQCESSRPLQMNGSDHNVRPPTLVLFLEPDQQGLVIKALRLQAR